MTRLILSVAVAAVVLVTAAVPGLAHADTALPALTGQTFTQQKTAGSTGVTFDGDCGSGTVTISYDITGTATGPYPGTFHEAGTVRFELVDPDTSINTTDYGYYEYRSTRSAGATSSAAVESTFSIDSPAGTVSGRRTAHDLQATCSHSDQTWTYDTGSWNVGNPTYGEQDSSWTDGQTGWTGTITKDGVTRAAQGNSYFYLTGYTHTQSYALDGSVAPENELRRESLVSRFTESPPVVDPEDPPVEPEDPAVVDPNDPPVAGDIIHGTAPAALGSSTSISMPFSDADADDGHTAVIDWGDGSTTDVTPSERVVDGTHVYPTPGVYTVSVTVTDGDGASDMSTTNGFVVIYDAEGGSVSGGGHIVSPLGAYVADPAAGGRATFGFVSKYQKGAVVPTGNTEFQFKAGDLNFSSTRYEWLVVAGTRAQYKGRGTVNGAGEYGFMLTAIEGSPDRFRIKIWNVGDGTTIYDNQVGEPDSSDPTTALTGGSIVIHK